MIFKYSIYCSYFDDRDILRFKNFKYHVQIEKFPYNKPLPISVYRYFTDFINSKKRNFKLKEIISLRENGLWTSKNDRRKSSYETIHMINKRSNLTCSLCGKFRNYIKEYDNENKLGICPCCGGLVFLESER